MNLQPNTKVKIVNVDGCTFQGRYEDEGDGVNGTAQPKNEDVGVEGTIVSIVEDTRQHPEYGLSEDEHAVIYRIITPDGRLLHVVDYEIEPC